MRIGYLECFAGISGDMLLGALVHAGVSSALLQETAASLHLGATLSFESVNRSGISAQKARVLVGAQEADATHHHTHHDHHHQHGRNLPAILEILHNAPIPDDARSLALRTFDLLGRAEAAIHNVPLEKIHFHEVGAVDAIIDITCAAVGLTSLKVDCWYSSPVNVGSGFVDCAHGRFPVPAPATASLVQGIPTYSEGPPMELTTPTGAALLRALDCEFNRPVAAFEQIGYGAGTRNPERFPNVLRMSIGESVAEVADGTTREPVTVLECAIDDLSPQLIAHTIQLALEHGALDAMAAPVTMKKGRLGALLTVLCRPADAPQFEELLFRETSTFGIRSRTEQRRILDRTHSVVTTSYGNIRIKTASLDGVVIHAQPEYEDCHACAVEHRVPLKHVMNEAMHAWKLLDTTAMTSPSKATIHE